MFNWEDLRYFVVFAREKSLSAAARRLGVDHATIARRITSIEEALQLKLVERRPRAYYLTAEGERIAELGARMETESFSVQRAALAGQKSISGDVHVSAPPLMAAVLIAPHLAQLRTCYPDLRLHLSGDTRNVSLLRREADIAIRLSRPVDDEVVVRKLGTITFSLYAAKSVLVAQDTETAGFIVYDDSMEGSPQQDWLNIQSGGSRIIMRSNDLTIQAAAARAGLGIAALPDYLAGQDEQLVRVAHKGKKLEREVWIALHSDLRKTPRIQAATKFLVGCLTERLKSE